MSAAFSTVINTSLIDSQRIINKDNAPLRDEANNSSNSKPSKLLALMVSKTKAKKKLELTHYWSSLTHPQYDKQYTQLLQAAVTTLVLS